MHHGKILGEPIALFKSDLCSELWAIHQRYESPRPEPPIRNAIEILWTAPSS